MEDNNPVALPPKGLAIFALLGPAFVWSAEYIGSGEVILATRMGAILGYTVLWAPIIGIILKYCIGLSGARYTVCTGEGMIDMFGRMPGGKNWAVWIVLVGQFLAGAISIGSVASAAGIFANSLIPLKPFIWGWIITIFAICVVWSGTFGIIKYIMSGLIFVIIIGVLSVAIRTFPSASEFFGGIFKFNIPRVPEWALSLEGVSANPFNEILPLIGWAAGGFASQVWYTYWVLGAGYGMARGRKYGEPADTEKLKTMDTETAQKVKGWCKVVTLDATVATVIGVVVTACFMMAGAGILRPEQIAPQGASVAVELSRVFSSMWGKGGAVLFMLSGCAALMSTQIGQFAGWPRLLADSLRICVPGFSKKFQWATQFRIFIGIFFVTSMVIIYSFGIKPVSLIKISALLDGLIFAPFQAVLVLIGLVWVLPGLLSAEAWKILKPSWIYIAGLALGAVVFGYFCIFQIPRIL